MDSDKRSAQVERLEVVETGRRRRWSEDEKLKIVLESLQAPRQVAATARRYGISRSLLLRWRRLFQPEPKDATAQQMGFVPARVVPRLGEFSGAGRHQNQYQRCGRAPILRSSYRATVSTRRSNTSTSQRTSPHSGFRWPDVAANGLDVALSSSGSHDLHDLAAPSKPMPAALIRFTMAASTLTADGLIIYLLS